MTTLTFGGLPQVPDTLTTGAQLAFPTGTPAAQNPAGPSGISGFLNGLFSFGTPVTPAASVGGTAEHMGTIQQSVQGNAPQVTGIGQDMSAILSSMGLGYSASQGGNPAQPALYNPNAVAGGTDGHGAGGASQMVLIGAALIGGFLLLRKH